MTGLLGGVEEVIESGLLAFAEGFLGGGVDSELLENAGNSDGAILDERNGSEEVEAGFEVDFRRAESVL